jgi:hypothetical protein
MAKSLTEIKSLARQHTGRAIAVLAAIMDQEKAPPAARVAAANSLMDRGWGKAAQAITGGDEDDNPLRLIVTGVKRDGD